MYQVRVIGPDGTTVQYHILHEPPDLQKERSLLLGLTEHWLDVQRVPFDYHSDSFCIQEDDEFDLEPFIMELLK